MKVHRFNILGLLFISLSMVGLPATASTPDGQTPAEETVCDQLKADGVSQGLYGLCLAFCEAQDITSEGLPITEDELAALQGTAPSGSILNSYNMIKKTTDPEMPCVVVDSTCPCWTDEELAWIDGYAPDGISELGTFCLKTVGQLSGTVDTATAVEDDNDPNTSLRIRATAWDTNTTQRCLYTNNQVTPPISRFLDVSQGTLSPGHAPICLKEVIERCAALGY